MRKSEDAAKHSPIARPGGITELVQTYSCPHPLTHGIIHIKPDGAGEMMTFDGDYRPGSGRATKFRLRLTTGEAAGLFAYLAGSGYETLPERYDPYPPPERTCIDCCSGSIEVKTARGSKRISYMGEYKDPRVEELIKGIDAALSGHAWEEFKYPWER